MGRRRMKRKRMYVAVMALCGAMAAVSVQRSVTVQRHQNFKMGYF